MSNIILGPILGFRGLQDGRWCTSALVVVQGSPTQPRLKFTVAGGAQQNEEKATLLKTFGDRFAWRIEWAVNKTNLEQSVDYAIDGGANHRYFVPPIGNLLRIAYASCFGFSSLKYMNKVAVKNAMQPKQMK